mmetsp:Transcript_11997/g.21654  ORF Transcript_11997/g.21654 Transcript_11997/m.21654 type:complete len:223 (+) Transcript_11997:687-1355(+)
MKTSKRSESVRASVARGVSMSEEAPLVVLAHGMPGALLWQGDQSQSEQAFSGSVFERSGMGAQLMPRFSCCSRDLGLLETRGGSSGGKQPSVRSDSNLQSPDPCADAVSSSETCVLCHSCHSCHSATDGREEAVGGLCSLPKADRAPSSGREGAGVVAVPLQPSAIGASSFRPPGSIGEDGLCQSCEGKVGFRHAATPSSSVATADSAGGLTWADAGSTATP